MAITPLPTPVPSRADPANFATRADEFLGALPAFATETNQLAVDVEGFKDSAEQAVVDATEQVDLATTQAALAADQVTLAEAEVAEATTIKDQVAALSNFVGNWGDQTGSASPPTSVLQGGNYWQLLVPLADITSVEPGTDVNTWFPIAETVLDIGSITYSYADLTASGLFVETAMTYLQSAYPELFAIIGIGEAPPITKLADPANLPGTASRELTVSTNDDYVLIVGQTAPDITLYSRSGDVLTREDTVTGDDPRSVGGNADLSLFLVGTIDTPYLKLYSRSGGTLTEETAPATGMSGFTDVIGVGFNFDGTYAAFLCKQNSYDNLRLYSVSGVTLTQVDALDTAVGASNSVGMTFHPSQNYLVCAYVGSNIIELYDFSTGALVLDQTIVRGAGGSPDDNRKSVQWSPDGNYLTMGTDDGDVRVWSFTAGVLAEIAQTYTGEAGAPHVTSASVNKDGDYISLGFAGSPYFKVFDFAGGVIGDSYTPSTIPSVQFTGVFSSPYTNYTYSVLAGSPNIAMYKADFPFDTATEFYVPDVDPLTPPTIGDWVPAVTGTAYVRAK